MLNQKEWIDIILAKTGCSKKEAKTVLGCTFEYIKELLNEDNPIKIQGFGVFKIKKVPAREIMNLQTKQNEVVPEHNAVVFKPSFDIDYKPETIETEDEELEYIDSDYEEEIAEEVEEVSNNNFDETIDTFDNIQIEADETEELDLFDLSLVWKFENKELNTDGLVALLKEKTALSEDEVRDSLQVIIDKMLQSNKTICEVKECDDSFDFIIIK